MASYKIAKISSQAPREHYNEKFNSTTYYIKVMLEGHDKPVSVGKRSPDALKVGETLEGTVLPTTYDTDRFKVEAKAFTPTTKDTNEIKAEWAIGQAVNWLNGKHDPNTTKGIEDIEPLAQDLFRMVERVKSSTTPTPTASMGFQSIANKNVGTGYEKAKAQAENIKTRQQVDEVFEVTDEPVNLNDIPF